jgi:RHS repeat-associated protein
MGSVVGEVDPSGNLDSSAEYDVYGVKRATTGTATSRQGFVGSLGHITDTETGLIYMQARYYDPGLGRFISEDPEGSGDNWYIYRSDNPTNLTDPDGQDELTYDATVINVGFAGLAALLITIDVRNVAEVLLASVGSGSDADDEAVEEVADQIISRSRKASVRSEFPGRYLNKTLKEIKKLANLAMLTRCVPRSY